MALLQREGLLEETKTRNAVSKGELVQSDQANLSAMEI